GYYPQTLDVLVDEGYLRQIPVDPFLGRNEWEEISADPDTSLDPSQPPGVWDVRSLAEGSTRDGTPYADL
ncbi:MAG: general secretion pathway protein GspG, partial [Bacteroidetes bacterium]